MKRLASAIGALAVVGAVACGTGATSEPAAETTTPPTMAAAATTAPSGGGSGGSAGVQSTRRTIGQLTFVDRGTVNATARAEVPIALENFAFSPTFVQGKPGEKVKLELTNSSPSRHSLTIEAQSIDRVVDPNAKGTVEVTIPQSGAVLFFCKFHTAQGMNGQLLAGTIEPQVVAPPGAKSDAPGAGAGDYGY